MADKTENNNVITGRLLRIHNVKKAKFSNAKDEYVSLWVEDSNGTNERCLLFTERELLIAEKRAKKNPENLTKK